MMLNDLYFFCSLSDAHLQLAPIEKPIGKKDGKRIAYDWNDAEIRSISEIIDGSQVENLTVYYYCHVLNAYLIASLPITKF